jgi:aspartyl-tRNA(Asn)/glutamyl-tRNA(Gln) amidotransferase subunit A
MSRDLTWLSISELGSRLRCGETSARQLAEHFLDRLEQHGPGLNAVVTVTRERALREADEADRELESGRDRGPLHGIPYGAKDLLATADYPTSWGAEPYRDQQFGRDAEVIRKLRDAGAVLVGKLAMVELAGGFGYEQPNAALTGPGRNAWNRDCWAGGSSSGSGAAVAAGLVPFAIGTETWGSIHCPSAFNGVTGLRPTLGRVSRDGAMALSWTMDKIGPMARSADDCATVLAAIAGPSQGDLATVGQPGLTVDDRHSGFRVGFLRDSLDKADEAVAANARASLDVLRQFGEVTEFGLPDLPWDDAASMIIMCEAASAFEDLLESGRSSELTAPEDRSGVYHALAVPAVDYLRALRIRKAGAVAMAPLLEQHDLLVAPAYSVGAPPAEGEFEAYFDKHPAESLSGMGNLVGLPSISVPNGFTAAGLPTSLELLGAWWNEGTILAAAAELQRRTDWQTKRPPQYE